MSEPADAARRVLCRLCGELIPATRVTARYVAADHLLDHHRSTLLVAHRQIRTLTSTIMPSAARTAAQAFNRRPA